MIGRWRVWRYRAACGLESAAVVRIRAMATTRDRDVTSIRIPAEEAAEMAAFAALVGTSRSRLLRAGFAALVHEDPDLVRARLAKLPGDRRSTWRLKPARTEEVAGT